MRHAFISMCLAPPSHPTPCLPPTVAAPAEPRGVGNRGAAEPAGELPQPGQRGRRAAPPVLGLHRCSPRPERRQRRWEAWCSVEPVALPRLPVSTIVTTLFLSTAFLGPGDIIICKQAACWENVRLMALSLFLFCACRCACLSPCTCPQLLYEPQGQRGPSGAAVRRATLRRRGHLPRRAPCGSQP